MNGTRIKTLFLSLLIATAAFADTYYVEPPPAGNDSNPGTEADPFATIQRGIDESAAGDTVIVKAGTYTGARFFGHSGTPGNPIILHGEPGAIVNSSPPQNTNDDNLWVRNSSYVIIEGFEVHSAGRSGIGVQAEPDDESIGVIIRNNHCHDNGVWGIFTGYARDIIIENNETSFSVNEHGIYVSNSSDNPIIRFNHSHHNNASGIQINADPALDGDGIITNAVIDSNIIHENGVGGAAAINLASVRNSLIVNNLLYNNRATGIAGWDDGWCPDECGGNFTFGTRDNRIFNNTIVMPNNGRWAISLLNGSINNEIKNNILLNAHSFRGSISVDPTSDNGLDSDYNIVTNRFSNDDGDTNMTLAAWQGLGFDANSFIPAANLFVDAVNGDYHLIENSEAIDAGITVTGVADDLDGVTRPQGEGFDVGAYESQLAECPSDTTDPQTNITSPTGGTVSGTTNIAATASDDCAVSRVEFYVDGNLIATDSSAPYSANWNTVPSGNGPHTLTTIAYDSSDNSGTSAPVIVTVDNPAFLFFDDFEDNNIFDWTPLKGNWSATGGNLTGTVSRKGDLVSPDFGGCTNCTIEADLRIQSTGARVSLLGWRTDKKNWVEVALMQDRNKIVLKQKSGGFKVAKQAAPFPLSTGVDYHIQISYNGTAFSVSVNGTPLFTVNAGASPNGNVGFRVKSTNGQSMTGSFREIIVY